MSDLQQSSALCFKEKCRIASLDEMWSQGKGGEVVGMAVEVKNISRVNTEHLTDVIISRQLRFF